MTINHSDRVTLLSASAPFARAHTHTNPQVHTQRLIYLVGYCILQEGIIFSNDVEKHWHTLAIVSIVSPWPIITIWLPFIHLCFPCLCVFVCARSCIFQWLLGEPKRFQVLLCASDCSHLQVMGLNKSTRVVALAKCKTQWEEGRWRSPTDGHPNNGWRQISTIDIPTRRQTDRQRDRLVTEQVHQEEIHTVVYCMVKVPMLEPNPPSVLVFLWDARGCYSDIPNQ